MSSPANETDRARVLERAAQECESIRGIWLGAGLPQALGGSVEQAAEPELAKLAFVEVTSVSPSGAAKTVSVVPAVNCPVIGLSAEGLHGLGSLIQAEVGTGIVLSRLICPFAIFDFGPNGLIVREIRQGLTAADLQQKLDAPLWAGPDLRELGTR